MNFRVSTICGQRVAPAGDRASPAATFLDRMSTPATQSATFRGCKHRVGKPETDAALGDHPQAPPSQPAEPVFDTHMVARMWLVSHEGHVCATPAELPAQ
jgi:hypothetical protein